MEQGNGKFLIKDTRACRSHAQSKVRWKSISRADHHVRGRSSDIAGEFVRPRDTWALHRHYASGVIRKATRRHMCHIRCLVEQENAVIHRCLQNWHWECGWSFLRFVSRGKIRICVHQIVDIRQTYLGLIRFCGSHRWQRKGHWFVHHGLASTSHHGNDWSKPMGDPMGNLALQEDGRVYIVTPVKSSCLTGPWQSVVSLSHPRLFWDPNLPGPTEKSNLRTVYTHTSSRSIRRGLQQKTSKNKNSLSSLQWCHKHGVIRRRAAVRDQKIRLKIWKPLRCPLKGRADQVQPFCRPVGAGISWKQAAFDKRKRHAPICGLGACGYATHEIIIFCKGDRGDPKSVTPPQRRPDQN